MNTQILSFTLALRILFWYFHFGFSMAFSTSILNCFGKFWTVNEGYEQISKKEVESIKNRDRFVDTLLTTTSMETNIYFLTKSTQTVLHFTSKMEFTEILLNRDHLKELIYLNQMNR